MLRGLSRLSAASGEAAQCGRRSLWTSCAARAEAAAEENVHVRPFSEIPGPSVLQFTLGAMRRGKEGIHHPFDIYQEWKDKYGKLVKLDIPGLKMAMSYDTDQWEPILRAAGKYPAPLQLMPFLFREKELSSKNPEREAMMIALTGPRWRENRNVLDQKLMIPREVDKYVGHFDDISADFVKMLRARVASLPAGAQVPLEDLMYAFSTEGIGAVLFDMRVGVLADPVSREGVEFVEALKEVFEVATELLFNLPLYTFFRTPLYSKFCKRLDDLERLSEGFIERAEAHHAQHPERTRVDLMHHMAQQGQSKERAMSNAVTLFFAGADSTSNSMLWLIENLGKNTDAQETLRKEVQEVVGIGTDAQPITPEALRKMKYLRACVKESLRVSPTGAGLVRVLDEDVVINGYNVPAGTQILLNQWIELKDERHYPEPHKFKPERHLDRKNRADPFVHLPFGWGPRMCQGFRVSELEMYALATKLVQHFSWTTNFKGRPYVQLFIKPDSEIGAVFTPLQ